MNSYSLRQLALEREDRKNGKKREIVSSSEEEIVSSSSSPSSSSSNNNTSIKNTNTDPLTNPNKKAKTMEVPLSLPLPPPQPSPLTKIGKQEVITIDDTDSEEEIYNGKSNDGFLASLELAKKLSDEDRQSESSCHHGQLMVLTQPRKN